MILNFVASIIASVLLYFAYHALSWLYGYYKRVKTINKIKGLPMYPFIGNTQLDVKNSNRFYYCELIY